jgi:hypothetical protein
MNLTDSKKRLWYTDTRRHVCLTQGYQESATQMGKDNKRKKSNVYLQIR